MKIFLRIYSVVSLFLFLFCFLFFCGGGGLFSQNNHKIFIFPNSKQLSYEFSLNLHVYGKVLSYSVYDATNVGSSVIVLHYNVVTPEMTLKVNLFRR